MKLSTRPFMVETRTGSERHRRRPHHSLVEMTGLIPFVPMLCLNAMGMRASPSLPLRVRHCERQKRSSRASEAAVRLPRLRASQQRRRSPLKLRLQPPEFCLTCVPPLARRSERMFASQGGTVPQTARPRVSLVRRSLLSRSGFLPLDLSSSPLRPCTPAITLRRLWRSVVV